MAYVREEGCVGVWVSILERYTNLLRRCSRPLNACWMSLKVFLSHDVTLVSSSGRNPDEDSPEGTVPVEVGTGSISKE